MFLRFAVLAVLTMEGLDGFVGVARSGRRLGTKAGKEVYANMNFGDTAGASLVFEDVAIVRGSQELMKNVNWSIQPGERWSIVGPNGVGKTSLLKAATGEFEPEAGRIIVKPGIRVGYLQQTAVSGSRLTVREELESCMPGLAEARAKKEKAEAAVAAGDSTEKQLGALAEAESAFENAGGYTSAAESGSVARGLGFTESDMSRPCADFSGGWQMRIALARLLLSKPEVLMLDEPSNHLDANARQWLAEYLQRFPGSLVLVSHDEQLLQVACESTAELMNTGESLGGRRLELYKSKSLEEWRQARLDRALQWRAEYERQQAEMNDLISFIERFGAKASKATQAQDRKKKLLRLQANAIPPPPADLLQALDVSTDNDSQSSSSKKGSPSLILPAPPSSVGDFPLKLIGASLGYSKEAIPILQDVNIEIESGSRIVCVGRNGAGKSTLIKAIAGNLDLISSGQRQAHPRLKIAVFSQDLSQELDPELTGLELVVNAARRSGQTEISEAEARKVLGALGLSGDKALRASGYLSGGEKAKVAMASFALTPAHFHVYDEPSNHADAQCVEALLKALQDFKGTLLVVSHDRRFVEALKPSHVLTVDQGTALLEARSVRDDDWSWTKVDIDSKDKAKQNKESSDEQLLVDIEDEQLRRRRFNAPKLLAKLEIRIQERESELATLDQDLVNAGADVGKCLELAKQRDSLQADLDTMYVEYEELDALLNAAPSQATTSR